LGFVPIDEVLRLLTRSHQQGSVDVTGRGLQGRVFVGKGGIDLATTSGDDDLYRHLLNSGYSDEGALRRVTSGETTLAAIADTNQDLVELIREMTVESLYQIAHRGDEFQVREGVTTAYASPKSFELESLLEDAKGREKDWEKVSEVIPDLTGDISFRRDLGQREEVTVKMDDWKVLSEIGTGASVIEIADHLGTTEFWTARVAARLVKSDLVLLDQSAGQAETEAPSVDDQGWDASEPAVFEDESGADAPADLSSDAETEIEEPAEYEVAGEAVPDEVEQSAPVFASGDEQDADPNESWWQEPKEEAGDSEGGEPKMPEVVGEGLLEIPTVEGTDSDVEEDTEAFLEKVFSELESSEPEVEEGHGLLRRRRMGTLRDFSSDS
jgi:predicted transcriptional regulator